MDPNPKPKRRTKGKRHPAHAASFRHVADQIERDSKVEGLVLTPAAALNIVVKAMRDEARRLRKIVR